MLEKIAQPIGVGVAIPAVCSGAAQRIQAVSDLPSVQQSVTISVGLQRIRAQSCLFDVGQSIVVRVRVRCEMHAHAFQHHSTLAGAGQRDAQKTRIKLPRLPADGRIEPRAAHHSAEFNRVARPQPAQLVERNSHGDEVGVLFARNSTILR